MTPAPSINPVARRDEHGFALLIVFLMAAGVALMLYQQLPRVAFESQRDKEESLIERGEQYKRGIQLYFVTFKKYPAKIEDLENTNNQRFLRRRYIDPMTGKDEWRLVHVNGAGQLTDSQVQKPPAPADDKTQLAANAPGANTGATPGTGTSPATGSNAPPEVNAAVLRRPSDRALVPAPAPGAPAPAVDPNDPRTWPPIFLQPAGQTGANPQGVVPQFPGQQFPGQQFPGQPFPGQQNAGQQLQIQPYPGQVIPGQQFPGQVLPGQTDPNQPGSQIGGIQPGVTGPGIPGQIVNGQFPGVPPGFPGQTTPGAAILGQPGFNPQNPNVNQGDFAIPPQNQLTPGNQQPGTIPLVPNPASAAGGINPGGQGGAPNPALGLINDLLRTPRQPPNAPAAANNPLNAGGLAGVASTFSGPSIKRYRERSKYNEWEFIFDLKQGLPGQPAPSQQQRQGGANQPPPGTPGTNNPSPTQP